MNGLTIKVMVRDWLALRRAVQVQRKEVLKRAKELDDGHNQLATALYKFSKLLKDSSLCYGGALFQVKIPSSLIASLVISFSELQQMGWSITDLGSYLEFTKVISK